MFKTKLFFLASMLGATLAEFVHDLDDEDHLAEISSTGINLTNHQDNKEAHLKVSSNQSTGYSWIVDHEECDGLVDITSGYVAYDQDDGEFVAGQFGEEVFTLTAVGFGHCTFRIAYGRVWEFQDFETHKRSNGYVIEIPIRVLTGNDDEYEEWNGGATSSDDKGWVIDSDATYDWEKDRSAYVITGIFLWIRSFTLLGFAGWMPTAIAWTRLNRYHFSAAPKFMWLIKWWSHIAGLCTTFLNLTFAGFLVSGAFVNDDDDESPRVSRGRYYYYSDGSWESSSGLDDRGVQMFWGVVVILSEVTGTIMYYMFRKGAYRYAEYVAETELDNY